MNESKFDADGNLRRGKKCGEERVRLLICNICAPPLKAELKDHNANLVPNDQQHAIPKLIKSNRLSILVSEWGQ